MAALLNLVRQRPGWTLFLLALFYRIITALFYHQPGYSDAYYYTNVAGQLWSGGGLRDDYLWNYLSRPLPESITGNPSNTYWMPLTSLIVAAGYVFTLGQNFFAGQIPIILLSSALVPIAFRLGELLFPQTTRYGWVMGFLTIFCGFYAPVFTLPDNFAPYALFSLLFLLQTVPLLTSKDNNLPRAAALLGLWAALAYLTRVDGLLLLLVPVLCLLIQKYLFRQPLYFGWQTMGLMLLVFGLLVLPWHLRNLQVTGQLFPGGGTKVIFMREYNDFFSYTKPLDLAYYLNQTDPSPNWGIGALLLSKLEALWQNLLIIARPSLFIFAPLVVLGLFSHRKIENALPTPALARPGTFWRTPVFLPFAVYGLVLYLAMSLVFTFPGTRGSLFHSAGGLLPAIFAALLVGLDTFVGLLGKISRPKAARSRQQFFTILVMAAAVFVSLGWTFSQSSSWDENYNEVKAASQWLAQNTATPAPVITLDAPTYWYANRQPALTLTTDSLESNLQLARLYKARYFILQPDIALGILQPLYQQKSYPGYKLIGTVDRVLIFELML